MLTKDLKLPKIVPTEKSFNQHSTTNATPKHNIIRSELSYPVCLDNLDEVSTLFNHILFYLTY